MINFQSISKKVENRIRLTEEDALYLYEHVDLLDLGKLADQYNQSKNGRDVYYNVNRHINPTNVCAKSCKFCAFSRKPGDEGAYEYSIDEIIAKAKDVVAQGATEVHMVGGLHPRWRFDHYLEIIGAIKSNFPDLHVKAFTAVEIDWLAAKARRSVEDTLKALKDAGLGSMPGGGAEIFHPEIRSQICDTKTTAERWIDIHRTAHKLGLRSNCTMLYGHIEKYHHRVDHMRRLRALQDETNGFNVFIPLSFQPHDNDMGINRYTLGNDDLRNIAVARLYLDNFQHIKAYWIMLGQDIAQLATNFGANDLDGTVTEEKISRMAGGRSGMVMGKNQIQSMIRKAGRIPVERDTLYNPVWRDPADKFSAAELEYKNKQVHLLLYRIEKGEVISPEEALYLTHHADLLDLAHAAVAKSRQTHHINYDTFLHSINEQNSDIDRFAAVDVSNLVSDEQVLTPQELVARVADISGSSQKPVKLFGMKAIWAIAHHAKMELPDLLATLENAGVRLIESAPQETELDFTNHELALFHSDCHRAGISTVAKLALDTEFGGHNQPLWDRFLNRAYEIQRLQAESKMIAAVRLETTANSFITHAEYLRAVSLARILLADVKNISAPFKRIPTMKGRPQERSNELNDPAFKLLGLPAIFGASDLGPMSDQECSVAAIAREVDDNFRSRFA